MLTLTYFGNATVAIESDETTLLIDPYLDESEEWPGDVDDVLDRLDPVDAVCVTHAAADHLGDAPILALEYGLPVVSEPATLHALRSHGVPDDRLTTLVWGQVATIEDLSVRALESHHASMTVVDGDLLSGTPLSFLVSDGDVSVYHMGDTSISRDLELFGDRYAPDVSLIGVGQAYPGEDEAVPFGRNIAELTTDEAVTVSRWVGSDPVVPIHYLPDERERFLDAMAEAEDTPEAVPLDPGDTLTVT